MFVHACLENRHVLCMSTYLTRTTHVHDVTVFKDSRIGCLDENDNGGVFKNLHFETRFQNYVISVPKMPLSCK